MLISFGKEDLEKSTSYAVLLLSSKTLGVVGAILIGGVILIICVSNFRNHRD